MSKLVLVDLENVGTLGLIGIERLDNKDQVVIFHGAVTPNVSIEEAHMIFNSEVNVELIGHKKCGKNALDFKIISFLGFQVANQRFDEYIIVSKDKGYMSAIEMLEYLKQQVVIRCITRIEELWGAEKSHDQLADHKEERVVKELLKTSKTKQEFHNKLVKAFKDTKKASEIYKREKGRLEMTS